MHVNSILASNRLFQSKSNEQRNRPITPSSPKPSSSSVVLVPQQSTSEIPATIVLIQQPAANTLVRLSNQAAVVSSANYVRTVEARRPLHSMETHSAKEPKTNAPVNDSTETAAPVNGETVPVEVLRPPMYVGCRSVRFGSYRTISFKSTEISDNGIQFFVKEDELPSSLPPLPHRRKRSVCLNISFRHINRIEYVLSQQLSVLFLTVSQVATTKIQETFQMPAVDKVIDDEIPYFNPKSDKMYHKYITVILSEYSSDLIPVLKLNSERPGTERNGPCIVEMLTYGVGNRMLSQTVPPYAKVPLTRPARNLTPTILISTSNVIVEQNRNGCMVPLIPVKQFGKRSCFSVGDTLKKIRREINEEDLQKLTQACADAPPVLSPSVDVVAGARPVRSMMAQVITRTHPEPSGLLVFPSASESKDTITVCDHDLECLEPEQFLNDTIIDFYLKYVVFRMLPEERRAKVHVFNSFFWQKLTKKRHGEANSAERAALQHKRVRAWTKNVNIFEKDFVVIPINENSHWYLAIICYPNLNDVDSSQSLELSQLSSKSTNGVVASPVDGSSVITFSESSGVKEEPMEVDHKVEGASMSREKVCSDKNVDAELEEDEDDVAEASEERSQWELFSSQDTVVSVSSSSSCALKSKQSCIVVMDSLLSGSPRYKTVRVLRDYLTEEYALRYASAAPRVFDRTTCRGIYPSVPQQDNYSDCGIYILQYAESFLVHPPDNFSVMNFKKLQNWFSVESVKAKRQQICDLLLNLGEEYKKNKQNSVEVETETVELKPSVKHE